MQKCIHTQWMYSGTDGVPSDLVVVKVQSAIDREVDAHRLVFHTYSVSCNMHCLSLKNKELIKEQCLVVDY